MIFISFVKTRRTYITLNDGTDNIHIEINKDNTVSFRIGGQELKTFNSLDDGFNHFHEIFKCSSTKSSIINLLLS